MKNRLSNIELLFDGDNRGWRTGIDCVLELGSMPEWYGHTLDDEEREILTKVKSGTMQDANGNFFDYCWIVDDFIDMAKFKHIDGRIFSLIWNNGSIFAISDQITEKESNEFFGEY